MNHCNSTRSDSFTTMGQRSKCSRRQGSQGSRADGDAAPGRSQIPQSAQARLLEERHVSVHSQQFLGRLGPHGDAPAHHPDHDVHLTEPVAGLACLGSP